MSNKLKAFFLITLGATSAWANPASCSGTYNLDPTTGLPATSGCEQADKVFSAFSTYINNGNTPTPGNINLLFSGSNPSGPITATFASSGWVNTSNTGSIFLYNYTQVDQVSNPGFVITGFDLNIGSTTFPNTCAPGPSCDSLQIITEICTNVNTNCSVGAPNAGEIDYVAGATSSPQTTYCYGNCNLGATTGNSIVFDPSLNVTSIFVTNWVILNNYDGSNVSLTNFANDYFETQASSVPEPATWALLGAALSVLSVIAISKK